MKFENPQDLKGKRVCARYPGQDRVTGTVSRIYRTFSLFEFIVVLDEPVEILGSLRTQVMVEEKEILYVL